MKQKIFKQMSYWASIVIVGVILGFGIQFVKAWTVPTSPPPGGNVGAPINTSNMGQSKQGNLLLNSSGTWANGLTVRGTVGIGTTDEVLLAFGPFNRPSLVVSRPGSGDTSIHIVNSGSLSSSAGTAGSAAIRFYENGGGANSKEAGVMYFYNKNLILDSQKGNLLLGGPRGDGSGDQRVGIGVDNPQSTLDVQGDVCANTATGRKCLSTCR